MEALKNYPILLLGAGSGLGSILAQRFATEGYSVIAGTRSQEKFEALKSSIVNAGGVEPKPFIADITQPDQLLTAYQTLTLARNEKVHYFPVAAGGLESLTRGIVKAILPLMKIARNEGTITKEQAQQATNAIKTLTTTPEAMAPAMEINYKAPIEPNLPIALVCPGQGLLPEIICAYYEKLREINPGITDHTVSIAQEAVVKSGQSFDLFAEVRNKDSEHLKRTAVVQPLVHALNIAAYDCVRSAGALTDLNITLTAGHSLGEYSAAVISGMFNNADASLAVAFRGKYMQAAPASKLLSIMGLNEEQVEDLCRMSGNYVALINAPTTIAGGGLLEQIEKLKLLAEASGGRRINELVTSHAFHTPLMANASAQLDKEIDGVLHITDPNPPIVANFDGKVTKGGEIMYRNLIQSIMNTVRWADCVQTMKTQGVQLFIESGPGSSLAALNRQNGFDKAQTVNILDLL